MIWIDYVLLAFLAAMIFGAGFFCGYVKDKKEVADDLRVAKEYSEEAEISGYILKCVPRHSLKRRI